MPNEIVSAEVKPPNYEELVKAARLAVISFFLFSFCVAPAFGAEVKARAEVGAKVATYEELVTAIRGAKAESRVRVEKAVEQERVREAWEIGKLIDTHVLQHKERADYGKQVLLKLAKDLGMSDTELGYMLKFARTYPISPAPGKLSWAHYRELLSVNDPREREAVASEAVKNKWSQKETREAVRKAKIKSGEKVSKKTPELLSASKPGIPYTYRVVRGTEEGERVLDLGFSNYYRPVGKFPFKEGDIVTSSQDTKGSYSLTPYSVLRTPYDPLYTYEIKVIEVIDGDTIKAVVDLGFGFRTVQTLRLRGIDAPEIVTADGVEAKKFLEFVIASPIEAKQSQGDGIAASSRQSAELLAMTTKLPVLIKTTRSDKYDRYLVDVWVGDRYLNQELIDKGLAMLVEE